MLKRADEKTARSGRRVAYQLALPRIEEVDHEVHDRAWCEKLTELSPERGAEEPFEGKSLDVVAGLREIEAFELFHDPTEGPLGDFQPVGLSEEVVGPIVFLRLPRTIRRGPQDRSKDVTKREG